MRAVIGSLSLRLLTRALTSLGVFVVANCSGDVERFNDNPFATSSLRPPGETTGSASRAQVQSYPMAAFPPAQEPLLAAKSTSKQAHGDKSVPAPATPLPTQAARNPVKWLPAPSEGTPSAPPDFLTDR